VTALSLITAIFPFVFFIPALIGVTLQNRKISLYCGFIFGLISFAYSYVRPSLVAIYLQTNPLLPMVPRVLAALLAHEAYRLVYYLFKSRIAAAATCGLVGSISNTILTITGLVLFAKGFAYSGINMLLQAIVVFVGLSALIEIIVNIFTVAPISTALYKNKKINAMIFSGKKSNTTVKDDNDTKNEDIKIDQQQQ